MELPRDIFELAHGHFSNAAATAAVRSADAAMVKPAEEMDIIQELN